MNFNAGTTKPHTFIERKESAFDNFYKQFVSLDTEATIDNNLNNEH